MLPLVSLFWNICLMREGPERVPTQQVLLALLIIGKIVLVLVLSAALGRDPDALSLATKIVAAAAAMGGCIAFALFARELMPRFNATFGAVVGTDLLLTTLYGSLLLGLHVAGIEPPAMLGLFNLWVLFVVGFIMHRAMNIGLGLGIAVALIIVIFSTTIGELVSPR